MLYIPSIVEIGPLVPEKKIFEGFLSYMGMVAILGHLGHVTCIMLIHFHFPVPKSLCTKLG